MIQKMAHPGFIPLLRTSVIVESSSFYSSPATDNATPASLQSCLTDSSACLLASRRSDAGTLMDLVPELIPRFT